MYNPQSPKLLSCLKIREATRTPSYTTIIFIIFWDSDILRNFSFTTGETMRDYYL